MMRDENERQPQNLLEDYASYRVFDEHYEEIGKVDDIFVDENDRPEYIGVKMGFLGMKSTLIPMDIVRANDRRELLEVAASKEDIKNAPSFDDDETVSPEHESEIRRYYGLSASPGGSPRGDYSSGRETGRPSEVDLEYGERGQTESPSQAPPPVADEPEMPREEPRERREPVAQEPVARESADDELRVQRMEEELRAGTREREAGAVNVRRRVRTDREQVRVPKKREEVTVERVPVDDESVSGHPETTSAGVESDKEEIRIPVVEEEVVVEKRPVVKEELRIKKRVIEEEEIVEEDVRKEEIDVEGEANYRDR